VDKGGASRKLKFTENCCVFSFVHSLCIVLPKSHSVSIVMKPCGPYMDGTRPGMSQPRKGKYGTA